MSRPTSPNVEPRAPSSRGSFDNNNGRRGSVAGRLLRDAGESFATSRLPVGMFAAFGTVASDIPSMNDIQSGKFGDEGWSGPGQRRNSMARRDSDLHVLAEQRPHVLEPIPEPKTAEVVEEKKEGGQIETIFSARTEDNSILTPHDPKVPYANGYQFPPKHTKKQAIIIGAKGFAKFVITPFGFLLTLYALNIVAWGGMLFLILIHATPAMGHPSYNSWDSGAKTWLEIDSQILNALFCVTGLGLIPWRFRDFYFLMKWRYGKDPNGLRRLAGIHRGWFRLEGSQNLDIHFDPLQHPTPEGADPMWLALPVELTPGPPLTGERATPSNYRKLDFVIWAFVWNTLFQIVLCGLMWGLNKHNRPGWSVGLFISLACIIASAGGWVIYKDGKRVKNVEGVPVGEEDMKILEEMRKRDRENGSV
ncbi:hypothetical protein EG329_008278 [Mollisiaceae sp. DMI_Dod_QoI]|nr:hypothetical protein EG329_008278 [Helotiales sp. DMI_Dod_QoI]